MSRPKTLYLDDEVHEYLGNSPNASKEVNELVMAKKTNWLSDSKGELKEEYNKLIVENNKSSKSLKLIEGKIKDIEKREIKLPPGIRAVRFG